MFQIPTGAPARGPQPEPRDAAAWVARGHAHLGAGQPEAAIQAFDRALALDPHSVAALAARGGLDALRGAHAAALPRLDRALALAPDHREARLNRAIARLELGQHAGAAADAAAAAQAAPEDLGAWMVLGIASAAGGAHEAAAAAFERACALEPGLVEAWQRRIAACRLAQRLDEALACAERLLQLAPDLADAHHDRVALLCDLGRPAAALAAAEAALARRPADPGALADRGLALLRLDRVDEAAAALQAALARDPRHRDARLHLGFVALRRLALDEAAARLRGLLDEGDHPVASFQLAQLLLLRGEYAEGFRRFEDRARIFALPRPAGDRPAWGGEDPAGRTLLLHAEQGLGDTIHFARYAPLLAARGARVLLQVPAPLRPLLRTLPGVTVLDGDAPPPVDAQCALPSLPQRFGTTLATIPAAAGYLHADPALRAAWRERLGPRRGLRIGLKWDGNLHYANDANRSVPARLFTRLVAPGRELVSVAPQVRPGDEPLLAAELPARRFEPQLVDFAQTAALLAELDLVISVDTAVAHLAGALGRPVWILLPRCPDWRWLLERADSPWYASARLFRQAQPGDWEGVLAQVARALDDFVPTPA